MILIFFGVTAGSFVLPNFSLPLAEGTYVCNYNFMRSNFLNHYPSSKISIDKAFTKKLHFLKKKTTPKLRYSIFRDVPFIISQA